jgi:tetrahydromethanopterin S-methyltransferase subunit G
MFGSKEKASLNELQKKLKGVEQRLEWRRGEILQLEEAIKILTEHLGLNIVTVYKHLELVPKEKPAPDA